MGCDDKCGGVVAWVGGHQGVCVYIERDEWVSRKWMDG